MKRFALLLFCIVATRPLAAAPPAGEALESIIERVNVQADSARREGIQSAAARMEDIVRAVSEASEILSSRIAGAGAGAEEAAAGMGETSTAMDEMNATVSEVARNASETASFSDRMRSRAREGAGVVRDAVNGIEKARDQASVLKEAMEALGEQAEGIGRIMTTISDIADQTNLLALNAAIEAARAGLFSILLTAKKPVPRDWFPQNLAGLKILCLACGGGQQAPILAAAGADVTVFDNSLAQLTQDRLVSQREQLPLKIVRGDMRDLSSFADSAFDLVFCPVSVTYIPQVQPVFDEAYRVLQKGGSFLFGATNPFVYIFDGPDWDQNRFTVSTGTSVPTHSISAAMFRSSS